MDHYFKERRRLRQTLKRAKGKWLLDVDRVEHLKRGIAEATRVINKAIKETNNCHISKSIEKINDNVNRFREIQKLIRKPSAKPSIKIKDDTGNIIESLEDKLETLRQFYVDLYMERTPRYREMPEVDTLYDSLDSVLTITLFSNVNPAHKPFSIHINHKFQRN